LKYKVKQQRRKKKKKDEIFRAELLAADEILVKYGNDVGFEYSVGKL